MKYIPTIGIECHVQLNTKTKLFAAVDNDARESQPNTLISHICLGMPGAMPYLNEQAVRLGCKAAFALGVSPQKFSKFDRKHYFYPDLPKGYQISQFNHPIVIGGQIEIDMAGKTKTIGITRAHLEEDAGKTTHPAGKDYSLVDLNRAGTPLIEIVSEPEIKSASEAKAYAQKLYLLMKYSGISNASLFHGNMRFDVNVSLSLDGKTLGIRTETKNLNSFKSVERACEYEIKRQTEILDKGGKIDQETRGWDDAKQKTFSQRGKEEAHDYRYFPDPDIPPLDLSEDFIQSIKDEFDKKNLETISNSLKQKGNLSQNDLNILLASPQSVDLALEYLDIVKDEKVLSKIFNWIINIFPNLNLDFDSVGDHKKQVVIAFAEAEAAGRIISTKAKEGLQLALNGTGFDYKKFIDGNVMMSDEVEVEKIVVKVLAENPQAALDIASGEMKAIGFLVGQVMKASKGKADPTLAQKLIKKQLKV